MLLTTTARALPRTAARGAVWRGPQPTDRTPLERARIVLYHFDVDEADRYRFALARLGTDVRIAVALDDALALVERLRADAVASARVAVAPRGVDCRLVRALRALPFERGGATPAVALTPWTGRQAREGVLALGFDGHVGAPCTPETLAAEISRVIPSRALAAGRRG